MGSFFILFDLSGLSTSKELARIGESFIVSLFFVM